MPTKTIKPIALALEDRSSITLEDLSTIIVTMDQFMVEIRKLKKNWRTGDVASAFLLLSAQYVIAMDINKADFMYWAGFFWNHADKMIEEMN
jgi:hypothetical protein